MEIQQFTFNSFQVNTYLLTQGNESILVDAGNSNMYEANQIEDYLQQQKSKLIAVVLTHGHIDHIVGCALIQEKYNVPVYLHKNDAFLIDNAAAMAAAFMFNYKSEPKITNFIDNENSISIGGFKIGLLHVPGHSPGSLVLHLKDAQLMVTGDVIFNGSIGRTDLPGGNYNDLIHGIKNKILPNLPETKLYPGHGNATTIASELKYNPFIK